MPAETVVYDIRDPLESPVIATYAYLGPPLSACGNPSLTIAAGGSDLAFLTTAFDENTKVITILL